MKNVASSPRGCVEERRRRHADPRSGERIYRLENIKREEPSAELFKVPADFALKAAPTRDTDGK